MVNDSGAHDRPIAARDTSTAGLHEQPVAEGVHADTLPFDDNLNTSLDAAKFAKGQAAIELLEVIRATQPEQLAELFARHAVVPAGSVSQRIGRFQIIKELGRGGHGVVFLVHDPRLNRRVALKVPRPEALMTSDLRRRFLREAEAAAALNHPNIVPIFEQGSVGPICYVASVFCEGPSLSQWLALRKQPVPARQAARIARALADAVEHAHSRGVLHRDLKPANVLWESACPTADGEGGMNGTSTARDCATSPLAGLRLTDFGLARIEGISNQTESSAIVGTPAYMSPEQAAGRNDEVGAATDIHGLGVILYQMLTLELPYRGRSDIETLRAIQFDEPVAPRRLCVEVPRDLEAICLKCLEKSAKRRYASAAALESDLRRFLEGRPVVARPVRTYQRFARWCGRNPALATVSLAALLLLLVGSCSVFWQWRRAEHNLAAARHQQQRAVRHLRAAQEAVDELLSDVATQMEDLPQTEAIRGRLLQKAALINQRFLQDAESNASPLWVMMSWSRAARIAKYLGHDGEEEAALQRIVQLGHAIPPESRALDAICEHWDALCRLAGMASNHGDFVTARDQLDAALAWINQIPDSESRHLSMFRAETWRIMGLDEEKQQHMAEARQYYQQAVELVESVPDDGETEPRLCEIRAKVHSSYAIHSKQNQEFEEALAHFQKTQAALKALLRVTPDKIEYQQMLAVAHYNLGNLHLAREEYDIARSMYLQAKNTFKRLAEQFPQMPRHRELWCYSLEGASLASPQLTQAELRINLRTKAAFLRRELQSEHPGLADNARALAKVYRQLAQDHVQLKEYGKARQFLLRSLDCVTAPYDSESSAAADHVTDAWTYSLLAQVESLCENWEAAVQQYLKAIETREGFVNDVTTSRDDVRDRVLLGFTTFMAGHVAEGIRLVRQSPADDSFGQLHVAKALLEIANRLDTNPSLTRDAADTPDVLRREAVKHLGNAWQAGNLEARNLALAQRDSPLREIPEFQEMMTRLERGGRQVND